MKTLKDLIEGLKNVEKELPKVLSESAEIMAHDGKALAEYKIKKEGFGAYYSTKTVPSFFLYDKTLNNRGKSYLDNLDGELTNWSGLREAQGLQTRFVDLSYSSKMWSGMRPDGVQEVNGVYYCVMGHNNNEGKNKMNWNFERYGDFIGKALEGEEETLKEVGVENLEKLLTKYI